MHIFTRTGNYLKVKKTETDFYFVHLKKKIKSYLGREKPPKQKEHTFFDVLKKRFFNFFIQYFTFSRVRERKKN